MGDEPSSDRARRHGLWLYAVGAAVYAVDRVTKLWAESALAGGPPIEVVPGILQLRFTTNPGGAFSLFAGSPWLFATATIVAVAVIVYASRRLPDRLTAVALGSILGGAIGNFTDRAVRGPRLSGSVVDFLDLHVWPVFNVADMGIVIGAALVLLASARANRAAHRERERDAARAD